MIRRIRRALQCRPARHSIVTHEHDGDAILVEDTVGRTVAGTCVREESPGSEGCAAR